MKKTLLLLGFVLATIAASAQSLTSSLLQGNATQTKRVLKALANAVLRKLNVPKGDKPLYNPEGNEEFYIMAYTDNNGFSERDYTNGKVAVRKTTDGTTWYINGLTPGGNRDYKGAPESWIEATKTGNELVIKAGQVLVDNQAKKLYLEIVHADGSGVIKSFEDETRIAIGDNGELTLPEDDILAIYEDADTEDEAGFFGFFYNATLKPMGDLVRFGFPKDSTPTTYVLSGTDAYGAQSSRFVKVLFSGDRFIVSGLSSLSPDEVFVGTVADGKATIPSFQIVKDADLFFYRIVPVTTDEDYNATMLQTIEFSLSDDRSTLTLEPEGVYLCETSYDLASFASTYQDVTLKLYGGDKPAKPATPEVYEWDSYNDALVFNVPTNDVDGNYINPDKLAYRVYLDGKRYTFTPTDYERLTEDMDELPFAFTDNFDIVSNGTQKVVYFHNINAKLIQIRSVYTVDGVANESEAAVYDFDPSAVNSASDAMRPVSVAYTSPEGMRLASPVRGSLVLKTMVYADGSRKTVKEVVK